jgi:hypothetical protein
MADQLAVRVISYHHGNPAVVPLDMPNVYPNNFAECVSWHFALVLRLFPNESSNPIGIRAGPELQHFYQPTCGDSLVLVDPQNENRAMPHRPECAREYWWVRTSGGMYCCPNGMRCALNEDVQIQHPPFQCSAGSTVKLPCWYECMISIKCRFNNAAHDVMDVHAYGPTVAHFDLNPFQMSLNKTNGDHKARQIWSFMAWIHMYFDSGVPLCGVRAGNRDFGLHARRRHGHASVIPMGCSKDVVWAEAKSREFQ